MMKKWLCMLVCLLVLLAPFGAMAAARMPEMRGNINDSADVLSAEMTSDLAEFSKQVTRRADIDLYMVTVHFLDGMDVQTYADQLFVKWGLAQEDILLVGAAGEDSFALHAGNDAEQKLGKTNVDNLLYISSEFAQYFREQQYDAAFASFCAAFNQLLEKQTGKDVRIDGMFGSAGLTLPDQSDTYSEALWSDVMDSINQSSIDYRDASDRAERSEDGMTAGGWLVLVILIVILSRQGKKDAGKKSGCGCLTGGLIALFLFMALLSAIF